jgi:hypothetical protein
MPPPTMAMSTREVSLSGSTVGDIQANLSAQVAAQPGAAR